MNLKAYLLPMLSPPFKQLVKLLYLWVLNFNLK
jgi:hypothetical protein